MRVSWLLKDITNTFVNIEETKSLQKDILSKTKAKERGGRREDMTLMMIKAEKINPIKEVEGKKKDTLP